MITEAAFAKSAAGLAWILLDVDGVLTDGRLVYTWRGEQIKIFNVRDGLAMRLAQGAGLRVGLLSGRKSRPLERRAAELDLDAVILGSGEKGGDFDRFLAEHKVSASEVAYIGDDLQDLPVLGRSGLSFAPADAAPEVRSVVHRVLETRGGEGAVREMIELILKARGDWQQAVARYSLESQQR